MDSESRGFHVSVSPSPVSERELSTVIRASFGDWTRPSLNHPDSFPIDAYIASLEASGEGAALAEARQEVSKWLDTKPTLRTYRLRAGFSQQQLAEKLGTSQSQVARMESGKQDLQLSTMKKLAIALGITIYAIVAAANA